ncbi:isochorismatase family cysteine hydrolase [Mycoplasmopsis lipofaciens]|uniref:isochorismatase family cysteine hydrolase n=1 Tax=Mycoplasmopsis lipofaciens TaxID=114884 RepID=UPI000489E586|nr:isochorismatase family cysteine hydrolase [Mycoplasmopsis lipofaciens]
MKKLIFVIDMINGFCTEGPLASNRINNIVKSIKQYLIKNIQHDNYFLCDAHDKLDLEMNSYPIHCLKNSSESEIIDELKPYCKNRIDKNTTNSFFALDTEIYNDYDEFEIVGCCTDICILQFVLSLKSYFNFKNIDKPIIVFQNLVSTFDSLSHSYDEYHSFALKLMKNANIEIRTFK